jgi:hypothetical protein
MILPDNIPAHIKDVFGYFFSHYRPQPDDRTKQMEQMTTMEILKHLSRHCPSELLTGDLVFSFLLANGYRYSGDEEMEFRWQLHYKG